MRKPATRKCRQKPDTSSTTSQEGRFFASLKNKALPEKETTRTYRANRMSSHTRRFLKHKNHNRTLKTRARRRTNSDSYSDTENISRHKKAGWEQTKRCRQALFLLSLCRWRRGAGI